MPYEFCTPKCNRQIEDVIQPVINFVACFALGLMLVSACVGVRE